MSEINLERCWLCTKIIPKATNPPDIDAEDMCECTAASFVDAEPPLDEQLREMDERITELENKQEGK
jgi:hypothetical protein